MPNVSTAITSRPSIVLRRRPRPLLQFKPFTLADIPRVSNLLQKACSRTCDYTIGGIYMWIDFFKYRYCIVDNTLFIKGVSENHPEWPAFSLPIGDMSLADALAMLEDYCAVNEIPLRFSAIPADRVKDFLSLRRWEVEPLTDWSDYLYDIESLASLTGKKLSKKRNHVNRFMADNPGYTFSKLTASDVSQLLTAMDFWEEEVDNESGRQERRMTVDVLRHLDAYGFEGGVLRLADGSPVAFTLAEVIGDTAFVHIEKMDHRVSGCGETVNRLMAEHLLTKYPQLRYANREEDCGDEGLRRAKESYHPCQTLDKYNLRAL